MFLSNLGKSLFGNSPLRKKNFENFGYFEVSRDVGWLMYMWWKDMKSFHGQILDYIVNFLFSNSDDSFRKEENENVDHIVIEVLSKL